MKTTVHVWITLLVVATAFTAFDCPAQGQGPTCYVSPSMEKTFVFIRELDSDGNPVGELGGRWVNFAEQAPVTSNTGNIAISYRLSSSDKEILMDPTSCADGNVISVP
jgi:hypothetical protein